MPLSVSIQSVQLAPPYGVTVSGTGSPDGAGVSVQVKINGGGTGNGMTVVNYGQWSTPVMMPAAAGQTGTATATVTDASFPNQSASGQLNFTL